MSTKYDERRTSNMNYLWKTHNEQKFKNELTFFSCQLSFEHKILINDTTFHVWHWVLWNSQKCRQKMTREQLQTWITFECDITHLEMKMNSVSIHASYRLSTKFCITYSLFHVWYWFLWNHKKNQQKMTREELQT